MAGTLPTAAELQDIPRIGHVPPRIVTGAPTSAQRRKRMRETVEHYDQSKAMRKNRRAIIKESAALRKDPIAAAPPEKTHKEWSDDLRAIIAANRDWWDLVADATQDGIIDLFWAKLTKGAITYKAFLLELKNLKIATVGLPRSQEDLRREAEAIADRCRRLAPAPPRGGW